MNAGISRKIILLVAIWLSGAGISIAQTDVVSMYREANIAYQKMNYTAAIETYEKMIAMDYLSPEIYYNLGNSYFKLGNTPKAVLNYERAKKLAPADEDILFNLKLSSLNVTDKFQTVPEIFYKRWINAAAQSFSTATWTTIVIVFTWLVFILAGIFIYSVRPAARKAIFTAGIVCLFAAVVSGLLSWKSYDLTYVKQSAIIMSPTVYVKSSPDEKSANLLLLHEGTKIEVMDQLDEWKKVRIQEGTVGWMKAEDIEIV